MPSQVILFKLIAILLLEVIYSTDEAPTYTLFRREKPIVETDFWHDHSQDDYEATEDIIAFREKYKDVLKYVGQEDLEVEEEFVFDEIKGLDRVISPEDEPVDEKPTQGTYQADMMFTNEQWGELVKSVTQEMENEDDNDVTDQTNPRDDDVTVMDDEDKLSKRRKKRKATAFTDHHWPKAIIPVRFNLDSDADKRTAIRAITHWTENTCLRFVHHTPETAQALGHNTYLSFESGLHGCWSYVGKVAPTNQTLSIGKGCGSFGTIVHELGHALGFHHEQSRPDRDFFVNIIYENILLHERSQFYKYTAETINSHQVPYDVGSIMHYGTYAFSGNGLPTITTKDSTKQGLLGQRIALSPADIKLIDIMYKCPMPRATP